MKAEQAVAAMRSVLQRIEQHALDIQEAIGVCQPYTKSVELAREGLAIAEQYAATQLQRGALNDERSMEHGDVSDTVVSNHMVAAQILSPADPGDTFRKPYPTGD